MATEYKVSPFGGAVNIRVRVPGSKSMTNRALLLAALAEGDSTLFGIGVSDDSRVFMEALTALGFDLKESYESDGSVSVKISGCSGNLPSKKTSVYVGSAGTAARFLTAMMALSDGSYEVTSSEQMKKRPMKELLEALEALGASFDYHEEPYAFPFTVTGRKHESNIDKPIPTEVPLNIDKSSQFLSALLLCSPMVPEGFTIRLTGTRDALSYVRITEYMMRQFKQRNGGYSASEEPCATAPSSEESYSSGERKYAVQPNSSYTSQDYHVEPDVSAACYFYSLAAVNGGKATVIGVNRENTQGDLRFLDVLERMGCRVSTDADGDIVVSRDIGMHLHGVKVDMSDFSDQTMTLAAIAPFAKGVTTITGVAHIRGQESNRIEAIVNELTRLGVECEELPDGVRIIPFDEDELEKRMEEVKEIRIETYNDHRMAMAFAVAGTFLPGVIIDNPDCCRKTFDSYFDILTCLRV